MKKAFLLIICILSLQIFAFAETPEDILSQYKIECGEGEFIDGNLVVSCTYSTPENNGARYTVFISAVAGDHWGGSGIGKSFTGEANNKNLTLSIPQLEQNFPFGTSFNYYAYIRLNETGEIIKSEEKTLVLPGTNIKMSDTGSATIPASDILEDGACYWVEYTPTQSGLASFTLEGTGGALTLRDSTGNLLTGSVEFEEIGSRTLTTVVTSNETIYLMCRVHLTDTDYSIKTTLENPLVKNLVLDANGGTWNSDITAPPSFVLTREYDDSSWGEDVFDLIEYSDQLSNDGFVLTGWNTKSDGTGAQYTISDSVCYEDFEDTAGEATLYAQWISVTCDPYVIFNSFFGSFNEENASAELCEIRSVEATGSVIAPEVYRDGYTLIGWYANNDLNNQNLAIGLLNDFYLPGDEISAVKNLILYAQWIPNSHSDKAVLLHTNAKGVGFGDHATGYEINLGASVVHLKNSLAVVREGFILSGWNTKPDGTGTQFGILDEINVSEAFPEDKVITLYAQWEEIDLPEKYFVFIHHEGTFANGKPYLIVDRAMPFEIPVLEDKDNRPFIGWENSTPSWTTVRTRIMLLPNEQLSYDGNAYFYPVYSESHQGGENSRWIFIDANGGYIDANPETLLDFDMSMWWSFYKNLETYNLRANNHLAAYINNMHREGYVLVGLNTKADGTGTQYPLDDYIPSAGLKTVLYAQWEKVQTLPEPSEKPSPGSRPSTKVKVEPEVKVSFNDVAADHFFYDEIEWAHENGYMNGTSETTFNPAGVVSRQQVWMILARLAGYGPEDMAAAKGWAVATSISDGSYPGNSVTRQQLVTLLWRSIGEATADLSILTSYPDTASVAEYAKEAMAWAIENGIINGTSIGTLDPTGTATRAQFAAILYRFA